METADFLLPEKIETSTMVSELGLVADSQWWTVTDQDVGVIGN
jgi:hypothetical protein